MAVIRARAESQAVNGHAQILTDKIKLHWKTQILKEYANVYSIIGSIVGLNGNWLLVVGLPVYLVACVLAE